MESIPMGKPIRYRIRRSDGTTFSADSHADAQRRIKTLMASPSYSQYAPYTIEKGTREVAYSWEEVPVLPPLPPMPRYVYAHVAPDGAIATINAEPRQNLAEGWQIVVGQVVWPGIPE